ncbi:small conductance mechanosensitive channel [Natronospira proteinivora]|uniref:Small-conductance mechanosensitive channel n=1 Tax=Natronospira proteinivora TaxID=1807133 RepID=A0ABT1G6L9_9GAMM|nr:mechanosensitive ion channel domain-containing protein [Natronospira proteinivora]MCP1726936.1 small conductance mechanosensitive channel [Natronospira proteinivora]
MEDVTEVLTRPDLIEMLITWGARLAIAIVIFIVGRWLAKLVGRQLENALNRAHLDPTLSQFGGTIATALITIIAVIAALTHLGVQVTSLVAILGAATLAIGLAMRDSLSNFAAGAMLMTYRPFKAGDFVEIGGQTGVAETVGIFHTRIRTTTNQEITIPNSRIYGDVITNYSARDRRRIDVTVGISYDDDIAQAKQLIRDVMSEDERLHKEPEPIIWVGDMADSSIDLWVKVWTDLDPFWDARSDLLENIKRRFDQEGITIPYPQRDVHLYQQGDA